MRFTAMNRGQRAKLALTAAALGVGLLTSGCSASNSQQTTAQYQQSDGTNADLGPLELRNMLIISGGEDKPGRVIGAVYNTSSEDVLLNISGAAGAQARIPVQRNSYILLDESAPEVVLSTTGGRPGSLVELTIREDGTNQNAKFKVPVMDGTIVDYKDYLPAGSEPTGSATPTSTPSPTTGGGAH